MEQSRQRIVFHEIEGAGPIEEQLLRFVVNRVAMEAGITPKEAMEKIQEQLSVAEVSWHVAAAIGRGRREQ